MVKFNSDDLFKAALLFEKLVKKAQEMNVRVDPDKMKKELDATIGKKNIKYCRKISK